MQVGPPIVVRKLDVVLHVAVISPVGAVQGGYSIDWIASAIVARIGCSFQKTSHFILEERIGIIIGMLFTKLGHNLLVLRSFCGLIDPFFPWKPFLLICFLQIFNDLQFLRVYGFFKFYPENLGGLCTSGVADEGLVNRSPAKFQILLELVTGNKLGSAHSIEGPGAAV